MISAITGHIGKATETVERPAIRIGQIRQVDGRLYNIFVKGVVKEDLTEGIKKIFNDHANSIAEIQKKIVEQDDASPWKSPVTRITEQGIETEAEQFSYEELLETAQAKNIAANLLSALGQTRSLWKRVQNCEIKMLTVPPSSNPLLRKKISSPAPAGISLARTFGCGYPIVPMKAQPTQDWFKFVKERVEEALPKEIREPLLANLSNATKDYAQIQDNCGNGVCFYASVSIGICDRIARDEIAYNTFMEWIDGNKKIFRSIRTDLKERLAELRNRPDSITDNSTLFPLIHFLKQSLANRLSFKYRNDVELLKSLAEAENVPTRDVSDLDTFVKKHILDWRAYITAPCIAVLGKTLPFDFDITNVSEQGVFIEVHDKNNDRPEDRIHLIRPGTAHYVLGYRKPPEGTN